ncbi:MAG: pyruvate kinase alpha/beta domain-containing protein [Pelolinea sp.]|nr:pyruvate kinase alpha/beta domain-containing protein [Pelolinea sp.]
MSEYQSSITYFKKPGKENSEKVMELSLKKAQELCLTTALVASTTGYTAKLAVDVLMGMDIVVVTHAAGYKEPDFQEFDSEVKAYVESKGAQVVTAQHTFSGVNRAIRDSFNGFQAEEVVANVLRLFGQGMKVVFEIAMMAADAGKVSCKEPVLVIGGTHRGADLGAVVIPTNSSRFFDLKIVDVYCMPSIKHPLVNK